MSTHGSFLSSSSLASTATGALSMIGPPQIVVSVSSPIYDHLKLTIVRTLDFAVHRPIQTVTLAALSGTGEQLTSAALTRNSVGNLSTVPINFLGR
jgi:hypothetical protein